MSDGRGWKTSFIDWLDVIFPQAGSASVKPPDRVATTENLAKNAALAMEVATRLHDDEVRRRQSADTKAALYLAFLAAVLPVVGVLTPSVTNRFRYPVLALDLALLAIALLYILMAGLYSAKALAPSATVVIAEGDLSDALDDEDARATIASRLIDATRLNYPLNNRKITYIRLTQAHIFRAFLAIMLIVAIDWVTDTMTAIGKAQQESSIFPNEQICTPLGLPRVDSHGFANGGLRYHLPGLSGAPVCLPLSISEDGTSRSTAPP